MGTQNLKRGRIGDLFKSVEKDAPLNSAPPPDAPRERSIPFIIEQQRMLNERHSHIEERLPATEEQIQAEAKSLADKQEQLRTANDIGGRQNVESWLTTNHVPHLLDKYNRGDVFKILERAGFGRTEIDSYLP